MSVGLRLRIQMGRVPVGPHRDDIAEQSLLNFRHLADEVLAVPALQADGHFQALLVGQLVRLHDGAEAGGVDTQRLLHENVLAGGMAAA